MNGLPDLASLPSTTRNGRLNRTFISRSQLPDQAGGRNDEDAPDQPPGQHLPVVEAGHNRLASAGIVEQPVAEPRLVQHVVVDGDPLVRQRVDLRNLRGEGRVVEVPVGEPFALDDDADESPRRW